VKAVTLRSLHSVKMTLRVKISRELRIRIAIATGLAWLMAKALGCKFVVKEDPE